MTPVIANDIVVLDIGGTRIRIGHVRNAILSGKFEILQTETLRVSDARQHLLKHIESYVGQHQLNLKGAVLGLPAAIDREHDNITHCNNIPQLQGHGLKVYLSSRLGCEVFFEQDIMLQVLGEWQAGAAQGQNSIFGVYFGTGIGAAYLLNGDPDNKLLQDIQAGHIPIMANGKKCVCGNTDCVEAYACGHTLTYLAEKYNCPIDQLFVKSRQSDADIRLGDELDRFVLYQAYMLATISTLFQPAVLLVGGGIPQMQGYPREDLITKTRNHLQKPIPADTVTFVWASLDAQAPLHGAIALLEQAEHSFS